MKNENNLCSGIYIYGFMMCSTSERKMDLTTCQKNGERPLKCRCLKCAQIDFNQWRHVPVSQFI